MPTKYIWFTSHDISKPVLCVSEKPRQIVIRFIPFGAEHLTIHLDANGNLIRNLWSHQEIKSEWQSQSILLVATKLKNYRNWQKHDKYVFAELPLVKFSNESGYHLVSRYMNLATYKPKDKYIKHKHDLDITCNSEFMLELYLSTPDYPCDNNLPRIDTNLGSICIKMTEKSRICRGL